MTDTEWNELQSCIRETAGKIASDFFRESYAMEYPTESKKPTEWDTERQEQIEFVRQAFERYRESQKKGITRKGLDWYIAKHARLEKASNDKFYKKRHNAMVLKYIISKSMRNCEIERKLGMSDNTFKSQLEYGIQEIAALVFAWNDSDCILRE